MIRVGIIGSGFGLYGLVPAFSDIRGCRIVAVSASNRSRVDAYCTPRGITSVYKDWHSMLQKEQLDAVAIAVIPAAQYEIAKFALLQGLHVFAEKPLADTFEHAGELLRLARTRHAIHAVDFQFPEIPAWQKLKQLLVDTPYGSLRHVRVNWEFESHDYKNGIMTWKENVHQGGGVVSFYASHSLYYLEYLFGHIKILHAARTWTTVGGRRRETGVDLIVRFSQNVTGSVHISCDTPGIFQHQIICTCQDATLVLENSDSFADGFTLTAHVDTHTVHILKKDKEPDARVQATRRIAARFIRAIKTGGNLAPSMADGVRIQKYITEIRSTTA